MCIVTGFDARVTWSLDGNLKNATIYAISKYLISFKELLYTPLHVLILISYNCIIKTNYKLVGSTCSKNSTPRLVLIEISHVKMVSM